MPKKLGIGLLVFVLLAVGGFAYLASQPDDSNNSTAESTTVQPPSESGQTVSPAPNGIYDEYSTENVARAEGDVYLFFHAPWCPQCRAIESDIKEQGVPDDITILKVDYDSNQSLRQKYGVTIQTTFVKVTKDGDFVAKYVAYNEPTFDSVIKNFIQ